MSIIGEPIRYIVPLFRWHDYLDNLTVLRGIHTQGLDQVNESSSITILGSFREKVIFFPGMAGLRAPRRPGPQTDAVRQMQRICFVRVGNGNRGGERVLEVV